MSRKDLGEGSAAYRHDVATYERFSAAEDHPGLVLRDLVGLVHGRDALELGCGTGKYVAALAPHARRYVGIDAAPAALAVARARAPTVELHLGRIEESAFEERSFDVVLGTWVLGTIRDVQRQEAALQRALCYVRQSGRVVLIENDAGGAFERLRGRDPDPERRTAAYNEWLVARGFVPARRYDTFFQFGSLEEAREVIGSLWGPSAAAGITGPRIEHRVVWFERPA